MTAKQTFLTILTQVVESAPAHKRVALLASLDFMRLAGSRVSALELTEALEEGVQEEITRACRIEAVA
jgi:hypothetical protein